MRITVDRVMKLNPCEDWDRDQVASWFGRRKYALLTTALRDQSIPIEDRLWLGLYFLDVIRRRLFVCECAERALVREREKGREPHADLWDAIEIARQYARCECSVAVLRAANLAAYEVAVNASNISSINAANSAAGSADVFVSYSPLDNAARSAAWSATGGITKSDSWDFAFDIEQQWQLNRLIGYHIGEEG